MQYRKAVQEVKTKKKGCQLAALLLVLTGLFVLYLCSGHVG